MQSSLYCSRVKHTPLELVIRNRIVESIEIWVTPILPLTIVQGVEIVILESPKCIRLLPIKVFLTFFFFFTFFF